MKNSQGASGKTGRTSSIDSLDTNQFPRSYLQAHVKKDHKPPVSVTAHYHIGASNICIIWKLLFLI